MEKLTDREKALNATDLRRRAKARARLEGGARMPHIQVNFVTGHRGSTGFVRDDPRPEVCTAIVEGETIRRRDDESEAQFKARVLGAQVLGKPSLVVWFNGNELDGVNATVKPPLPEG